MNNIIFTQKSLIMLKRHALLVLFICFIPHITTQPAWLFIMLSVAIGYQFIADYFALPAMSLWLRVSIVAASLFLIGGNIFVSGFFIRFLLIFIILKCLEINTTRDLKVLILCNFYLIFSALIVTQDLWIVVYLFTAIFANLSLMIKLSAPSVSLSQIGSKSGMQLLIVIPLSLILFYLFPRIDPLWKIHSLSKARTGIDEKMDPGSISELFNDDSLVMQISFKKNPTLQGYWREIILSSYNGASWYPSFYLDSSFAPLIQLKSNEAPDFEILLEPNNIKWLLYDGYPVASGQNLLFSPLHGLIHGNNQPVTERFSYSLKVQLEPYHALNKEEYADAIQLPKNINPRLSAWAKDQFSRTQNDTKAFIGFLHQYIHEQAFWYTLTPPLLSGDVNQMDAFWFDSRKGFCEHYASAVTLILRAAGIPARVILGYHGGKWNPVTQSITIQQYNAHAWVEYWQENLGWQQLDPTSFIASERVDQVIGTREISMLNQSSYFSISEAPWREKINILADSMRFYTNRWLLFYNQNTQQSLLQQVGLGGWAAEALLQAAVVCMPLFFFLIGLYYNWRQKRALDPLLHQYHLLQQEFRRFNISTPLSATLGHQSQQLVNRLPHHAAMIELFIDRYDQLRLKPSLTDNLSNKKETLVLFTQFRKFLSKISELRSP
jgi:transglutaminase-like putative cysteine protease